MPGMSPFWLVLPFSWAPRRRELFAQRQAKCRPLSPLSQAFKFFFRKEKWKGTTGSQT